MAVAKKKQESALELCLHFPSFLVHVALVLIVGWISSHFNFSLPLVFTFGLAYLYLVEGRTRAKTETRIRSEERRANDRKRLLSDAETARWLNSTVEAVWPIFLEKFASQKFLMSLAPWFMQKYKPWTAKKVVLQQLYLGRCPPVFTMLRCGRNPKDGDHLVLEMDMKFVAARDMSAVIAVQMKKRVGLGLWTSLNISNIQIEGKLRVGVRFTRGWPLVERLRVCFSEAPILRMTAKPIINYGIDVTDLPGIASWIDKMIADALEHSLVEPNLLEVEVEKLVGSMMAVNAQLPTPSSTKPGPWFSVRNPKLPLVATVTVEILEGKKLKPSDPNGKADPYVNVKLGSAKYVTAIRPKTLKPAWFETFQFPVNSWDVPNKLELRVLDKDRFGHDDNMGYKDIECQAFNDGQRHEMWVTLDEVKTGQLRIAMTVEEVPVVESVTERTKTNGSLESGNAESEISSLVEKVKISAADSQGHENDEDVSDSDYEECALKGEREAVDVGYGHLGAVSIVTPGKAQVKDATNPERLRHRKKPAASSVQVDGDGRSKLRRLLKKDKKFPSQSDSSGELGVIAVGEKGTEVHMTVETDGEGCMNVSDCIPSSGELQLGSGDGQYPDESKTERRGLKKVHNIMFRLGKRAHIVSSAISKMSPSRKRSQSGNNLGETSGNVNQEKAQVPEASTATGESTGDKDVLQAENTSGTERRVNSLNDIETCTEIHESDAETGNSYITRDSYVSTAPSTDADHVYVDSVPTATSIITEQSSPATPINAALGTSGSRHSSYKDSVVVKWPTKQDLDYLDIDTVLPSCVVRNSDEDRVNSLRPSPEGLTEGSSQTSSRKIPDSYPEAAEKGGQEQLVEQLTALTDLEQESAIPSRSSEEKLDQDALSDRCHDGVTVHTYNNPSLPPSRPPPEVP